MPEVAKKHRLHPAAALLGLSATPAHPQATIGGEWRDDVAAFASGSWTLGSRENRGAAAVQM
jgi:hypothetical protein